MEFSYTTAFNYFNKGNYEQAKTVFFHLTRENPWQFDYWMGLAASYQMLARYEDAIDAYSVAAVVDGREQDPLPHLHAAECLFVIGDPKAKLALRSAEEIATKVNNPLILKQLELIKQAWCNQEGGQPCQKQNQ